MANILAHKTCVIKYDFETVPMIAAMKKVLSAISASNIIVNEETNPSRNKLSATGVSSLVKMSASSKGLNSNKRRDLMIVCTIQTTIIIDSNLII